MSNIDVLKQWRKDYDQDARNDLSGCLGGPAHIPEFKQKEKALTEAIEALVKVAAIRELVSLINKKAQKHGDLSFERLLEFIDSLDGVEL
tara:strand:- start:2452 stop:2721 length:270 start_codon:yes stop_codon:yes gene_type:complete